MEYCLTVKNLHKSFPASLTEKKKVILRDLSFSVRSGRVTGFVGANGSGKTTSIKCILNFIIPQAGEISFFKNEKIGPDVLRRIGFFPERPYLYEFLTTDEYLRMHWDLSGGGEGFEQARDRVLEQVNLQGVTNRRLRSFSKGMLQRIGIGQAIIRNPELLILDEPMSGLDPDGRLLMKDILRGLHAQGASIFFSSHLLHDLEELCQDVVIIEKGELLYCGEIMNLKHDYSELSLEQIFREIKKRKVI